MNRSGGASTRIPGHTLREEGRQRWHTDGELCADTATCGDPSFVGACTCGALSPAGLTIHGVRRWHRQHKDTIRAAS